MAVSLTVSDVGLNGAAVDDVLATPGPDNRGVDLGSVVNGSFAPLTDKTNNQGRKGLWIYHNATVDPITGVGFFLQEYGTGTGFGYAGADSAANDLTTLQTLGTASGSSKNNADGNSGGLWIDQNALLQDTSGSTQFDFAVNGIDSVGGSNGGDDTVRIFGDNTNDGIGIANAFDMHSKSAVYTSDLGNGGDGTLGYIPNGPATGIIGKSDDTTYGNHSFQKVRIYVRSDTTDGGIVQFEKVIKYSFTAALSGCIFPVLLKTIGAVSGIM